MANYKYICSDCGNVFDIKATIQEKEDGINGKFICERCHSTNVKFEFSAVNFIKNIFANNSGIGGCRPGEDSCGAGCKPDEKKKICGSGNSNGGFRG